MIGSPAANGCSYKWSPGALTAAEPVVSPLQTTTYIVSVSNGICGDKDTVNVTVGDEISAGISGSKKDGYIPLDVKFDDNGKGLPAKYLWDFGNGDTSSAASPNYYLQKGRHLQSSPDCF